MVDFLNEILKMKSARDFFSFGERFRNNFVDDQSVWITAEASPLRPAAGSLGSSPYMIQCSRLCSCKLNFSTLSTHLQNAQKDYFWLV